MLLPVALLQQLGPDLHCHHCTLRLFDFVDILDVFLTISSDVLDPVEEVVLFGENFEV